MIRLGDITLTRFLREYWQRRPLLVRQALPGFVSPLTPDELAGLALEAEVESRIVLEQGRRGAWELRNGPFTAREFARLPPTRWTLLVQAVDQWVPEVRALREAFGFLPAWRFDDVMVSYAPDKGGVGPHFDYYDVFLLQGLGKRRWRIGQPCDAESRCREDTMLRILEDFETREEYVLEPGDLLYLPPGLAHWGIAEGECMTYSVGFRAPSHAEILTELGAEAAARLGDHERYCDPPLAARADPGEIPERALAQLQQLLRRIAADRALLRDWLGRYMTERKYVEIPIAPDTSPAQDWPQRLREGALIERHPASRFAWSAAGGGRLYVDGAAHACDSAFARAVASGRALDWRSLGPFLRRRSRRELLGRLLADGALYLSD